MLPLLVEQAARTHVAQVDLGAHDNVAFPFGVTRRDDPVRAWVTIIEGCNEYCSFCVVPYTRGHERMRPKSEILAEVRDAAARGLREVQLLGQIVNHYQAPDDPACDFAALLEAVHEVEGIARIRFASPHPRHVTPRLIAAIRDLPKVCKHLHLPVQSGSTRRARSTMRRRYTRDDYLALVDRLRAEVPGIALSTDMIVGFPGRDGQRLRRDAVADRQRPLSQHVLVQVLGTSEHAGVEAHADDVPETEKARRIVDAAGAAARRPARAARSAGRPDRRGPGRCRQPAARHGAVGPDDRQHGGELPWRRRPRIGTLVPVVIRRAGPNSLWGEVEPTHAD